MNMLRVLVIDKTQDSAERLAELLATADHNALPAAGLEEASEALFIQRFDAVLLGSSQPTESLQAFTAKLRELEKRQRAPVRAPILSLSSAVPAGAQWCVAETPVDGYLAESFHPDMLFEAVSSLAAAVSNSSEPSNKNGADLPVFEIEHFRAQVGYDEALLVEILDLFLAEAPGQVIEMRASLAALDYDQLSRLAHTIKGSFAALHATRARMHSQELEIAARDCSIVDCRRSLSNVEYDLELLEPQLLALRAASV